MEYHAKYGAEEEPQESWRVRIGDPTRQPYAQPGRFQPRSRTKWVRVRVGATRRRLDAVTASNAPEIASPKPFIISTLGHKFSTGSRALFINGLRADGPCGSPWFNPRAFLALTKSIWY